MTTIERKKDHDQEHQAVVDRSRDLAAGDRRRDCGSGGGHRGSFRDRSNSPAEVRQDKTEGPDTPIAGVDLQRASATALEHTGQGRVTDTEVGDEESH